MRVKQNLEEIQAKIAKHVPPSQVTIVAAAKKQSIDVIREAFEAGIRHFGVNYAQEGKMFQEQLKDLEITWHFIGHIQSRKVKELGSYPLVQSMDRIELVEALGKMALNSNEVKEILVEVNIGEEPQKSGVQPKDLQSFLERSRLITGIRLKGLMAMPPVLESVSQRAPYFESMREIFSSCGFDSKNHFLSMGTSEDYELAVKHGANMIRLGTCLLGKRST